MWPSLERFRTDLYDEDSRFWHDDDEQVADHAANAVVRARGMDPVTELRKYILGKASEHQKFDFIMSSVLAHEATADAIAAGANQAPAENYVYY
jgi:dihydroorotase